MASFSKSKHTQFIEELLALGAPEALDDAIKGAAFKNHQEFMDALLARGTPTGVDTSSIGALSNEQLETKMRGMEVPDGDYLSVSSDENDHMRTVKLVTWKEGVDPETHFHTYWKENWRNKFAKLDKCPHSFTVLTNRDKIDEMDDFLKENEHNVVIFCCGECDAEVARYDHNDIACSCTVMNYLFYPEQ